MTPPTIESLAAALSLSPRRISQLKAEGMPCETLEAAIAWRSANRTTDSTEELRRRRIALLVAQERRVSIENDVLLKKYILISDMHIAQRRCLAVFRAQILAFPNSLSPKIEGLAASKMSAIIKDEVYELLTNLSRDLGELAESESLESEPPLT